MLGSKGLPIGNGIWAESGRGLGDVTATIFGSTVGYPSDSLASCKGGDKQDGETDPTICVPGADMKQNIAQF